LSEKILPAAGFFSWSNTFLTHYFIETNLAKNISPSPKGLMGFISCGEAIFLFGSRGLAHPKPMPGYVLDFNTFPNITT